MSAGRFGAALSAEWLKLRTLRSTWWTLFAAFAVILGISAVYGTVIKNNPGDFVGRGSFDPVFFGFAGHTVGQLAMVCFGVLAVSGEYSSGTIRASLAAVPDRGLFWAAKAVVVGSAAFSVALPTAFAAFVTAQSTMGDPGVALGDPGALRATFGLAVYLTLLCLLSAGVAAMLRGTALSLGILVPLFFILGDVLGALPGVGKYAWYLPNLAGSAMMRTTEYERLTFGAGVGLAVLLMWTVAALAGGLLVLRRRDA
ncbi:ABC transporter permease [Streptomyces sp. NPDC055078]